MNSRACVLFVHNLPGRFVLLDLALLRERYAVTERYQPNRFVNLTALERTIRANDLVFGWFASWHTFFPVLLAQAAGKPSLLVVGGYDSANLPEIGYGSMRGGFKRWVARRTMRSASGLVTNSNFTKVEVIRNANVNAQKVTVIYHGLECPEFRSPPLKVQSAITIGHVDWTNLKRKGLEHFVRAAADVPEIAFTLVGKWHDGAINYLKEIATPNVQFTGQVDDNFLNETMAREKCMFNPRCTKGLAWRLRRPCSMNVYRWSRGGALPEVVGDCGVYVKAVAPQIIVDGIRNALTLDATKGRQARDRIVAEFPLDRRRRALFALIDSMVEPV